MLRLILITLVILCTYLTIYAKKKTFICILIRAVTMSVFHYTIIVTKIIHDNDIIAISVENVLIVISCRLRDRWFFTFVRNPKKKVP